MVIEFPGAHVDSRFGPYTVKTGQPPESGGEGSAPMPFATFLASIGTCAGIYVLGFCRQRDSASAGIRIVPRIATEPQTDFVGKISLDIQHPPISHRSTGRRSSARWTSAR